MYRDKAIFDIKNLKESFLISPFLMGRFIGQLSGFEGLSYLQLRFDAYEGSVVCSRRVSFGRV
jgi:hypothetical protein